MRSLIHMKVARRARNAAWSSIRFVQLRRGLKTLAKTLRAGGKPQAAVMRQLVRGWGNEAWSANVAFLIAMLEWLPQTSGTIVECGSGLSTMLLAAASEPTGRRVFSLEHNEAWASIIERRMPKRLRGHLELTVAPLRPTAISTGILSIGRGFAARWDLWFVTAPLELQRVADMDWRPC